MEQSCIKKKKAILIAMCSFLLSACASNDQLENPKLKLENQNQYRPTVKPKVTIKEVVTLKEAANAIVIFHPRMKQAIDNESSVEEMISSAKSAYFPQINGGIGMRKETERSTRYDKEYLQEMNLEITQVLYDFGKISSSIDSATYGFLGAKVQTLMTNEELMHLAAMAVLTTNKTQALNVLAKEQVETVRTLSQLVDKRNEEGASNLSDVYQAKSRLDDVLSEELDVKTQHQSILNTLRIIIGQPQIKGAEIGALPPQLSQACFLPRQWDDIPQYQLADLDAERALADFEKAKADELPTISFRGHSSTPLNATPRYGSRVDTTLSVNVSVPLYTGGALSSNKNMAQNQYKAATARKAEVRLEVDQVLNEATIHLQNLQERRGLLVQRIENLRQTKELYRKQYLELGTRTLVDLLNSEQEFHRAQVDASNNRFDIIQTQLVCAYHQGKLGEYFSISSD